VHEQFFRHPATEEYRNAAHQIFPVVSVAVLLRQLHGEAQGPTPGNDGDLVYRIGLGHQLSHHGVAGLVISGIALFVLTHGHAAPFGAHHDLILGLFEVIHIH